MDDAVVSRVPPGWHPDPAGAPSHRWWDGARWTEHLRPNAEEVGARVRPEKTSAHSQAESEWLESLSSWSETGAPITPVEAFPLFGDAPPVSYRPRALLVPEHGRTTSVWLIVFLPLVQAVATIGTLFLIPGLLSADWVMADWPIADWSTAVAAIDPSVISDWVLRALVPLASMFTVLGVVLAFQDRSRLRLLGHDETAAPWWMLLSAIIYLAVRGKRVRQQCLGLKGSAPFTTFVCLYVAPVIALGIASTLADALEGALPK